MRLESEADKLADAQVTYRKARILYSTNNRRVAEALPLLETAAMTFRRYGSPMALVATYFRANATFDLHNDAAASRLLDEVYANVPTNYKALRAQIAWQRTTMLSSSGRVYEALEAGNAALLQFRALNELDNEAMMERSLASLQAVLGDNAEAWRLRRDAFGHASESGRDAVVDAIYSAASLDALRAEQWDVAAALLDEQAHITSTSPRLRAEA